MAVVTGQPEHFAPGERQYIKNISVAYEALPAPMDAEAYMKSHLAILAQSMAGFQRLRTDAVDISGIPCPLVEFRCQGPEGMLISNLSAYVVRALTAYTL